MNITLDELHARVQSNPINEKVIKHFEIQADQIVPYQKALHNWAEGLGHFMEHDASGIPENTRFVYLGSGLLIQPETGEIFGIMYGMYTIALKIHRPVQDKGCLPGLRGTYLKARNLKAAISLRLNYWRNLNGDDVYDLRELGKSWAVGLYFVERTQIKLKEAYDLTIPTGVNNRL